MCVARRSSLYMPLPSLSVSSLSVSSLSVFLAVGGIVGEIFVEVRFIHCQVLGRLRELR